MSTHTGTWRAPRSRPRRSNTSSSASSALALVVATLATSLNTASAHGQELAIPTPPGQTGDNSEASTAPPANSAAPTPTPTATATASNTSAASASLPPGFDCPVGWEVRAAATAAPSVVRVKTPDGWGAGFFYENSTTVVTALHVVAQYRWVQIIAKDGAVRRGRVVHNGVQELDLAVIELESPFQYDGAPLQISPNTPVVAMPVLMIGHPGSETGGWSVSWGRIGSERLDNGAIEVDGTANPGNSGGPLLDCEGRVIGVISYLKDTGITMAVPITELPRPGDRFYHLYRGAVAAAGRLPTVVYSQEGDLPFWGLGLGFDFVFRDRWLTALQFQYQWHDTEPSGSLIERWDRRWQVEFLQELRARALGVHGLGLGVALSGDYRRELRGSVDATDPAAPALVVDENRNRSTRIRPMLSVSWELNPLFASYAFQLDTLSPEFSAHRIMFGLRMENVLEYE